MFKSHILKLVRSSSQILYICFRMNIKWQYKQAGKTVMFSEKGICSCWSKENPILYMIKI